MKSIRLSLIVYFLVLLGLSLGAVSAVFYETSHRSLKAAEASKAKQLQTRYDQRCKDERAKLDTALLRRAQHLAHLAQAPWDVNRYQGLYLLGLLSAGLSSQGHVQVPGWLAEVVPGRLAFHLRGMTFSIIFERDLGYHLSPLGALAAAGCPPNVLAAELWASNRLARHVRSPWVGGKFLYVDNVFPGNTEGQEAEYCQIVSEKEDIWQRSRSLRDESLPLPREEARKLAESQWFLKDVELAPGKVVRMVTYKSPMPRLLTRSFGSPNRGRRGTRQPGRGARTPPGKWTFPTPRRPVFFIQYARETAPRDAALAQFKAELDKDLANLTEDTNAALATIRSRLLWISLLAFAAAVVGGFWLVHLGLSPLRRLSEAVSRVSEKDFRLQFADRRLTRELQPIVDRLNQTLEMLKRAFAREKQAAADISHELRTPLAALLTTTEVALRKPRAPEEYRELLQDCRESGKQMSQLVERLLALARLDAGVDRLQPREVDAAALAEQCAALVRPLAEAQGLSLRVHKDGPTPLVADADKLREVVTNLLHNAIQYNRPHGTIDLVVGRHNGTLQVEVRDTGIGIPEGAREHIFERFYRADPSRQADGLHAGLGLAIVKNYLDLMGGTIGVDSAEGQGSTFRVRLPAQPVG